MDGFLSNGYEIFECNVKPSSGRVMKYWKLYKECRKVKGIKFDYVIVAFPGHTVVWLARLFFGKDIIFDAFVSLYNSEVEDRKTCSSKSFRALYFLFLDWYSCSISKKVLLDTNMHIDYFIKKYKIPKEKFIRIFVGSNEKIFFPLINKNENDDKFIVHFHGTFIPLQGIEYVVKAAKLLENENIIFNIIGKGQEYNNIQKLVKKLDVSNINFVGPVFIEKLPLWLAKADICLGIFGSTPKTNLVIPNKIYESMACKKAILTAKTDAIMELFEDKKNILLCNQHDERDLANKVRILKSDIFLKEKIAENANKLFKKKIRSNILVKELLKKLK
jgi:glycosyltransferase involved in cell wall biosynthesis